MFPVVVPISGYFANDDHASAFVRNRASATNHQILPDFLSRTLTGGCIPISEEVMVPAKAAPNRSSSLIKSTSKPARPPRASRAVAPASKRSADTTKDNPRVTPIDAVPSLAERVQTERERIFKVRSIVECCRFATATLLEVGDTEFMIPAFEAVCDLLNDSAEELEQIATESKNL